LKTNNRENWQKVPLEYKIEGVVFKFLKKKYEDAEISDKYQFVGQLLGLSPPSVFGAENRTGGYSKFKVSSKDLQEHFLKIDLKKSYSCYFLGLQKIGFFACFSSYIRQ